VTSFRASSIEAIVDHTEKLVVLADYLEERALFRKDRKIFHQVQESLWLAYASDQDFERTGALFFFLDALPLKNRSSLKSANQRAIDTI